MKIFLFFLVLDVVVYKDNQHLQVPWGWYPALNWQH